MDRHPSTILSADMVGYSRLMAAGEAGTFARLKQLFREVIDPEIARAGGETVQLSVDGMLVIFGSVVAARGGGGGAGGDHEGRGR